MLVSDLWLPELGENGFKLFSVEALCYGGPRKLKLSRRGKEESSLVLKGGFSGLLIISLSS